MANELTHEHAKGIYDIAVGAQRAGSFVYAIRLLHEVLEIDEPFYTPFALQVLAQCYGALGQHEREIEVFKLVTRLTNERQRLLNPGWLALCYQRTGNLKTARTIVDEMLQLSPNDVSAIAAKAEISLLQGDFTEAEGASRMLRERPEPAYQILGRALDAFKLAFQNRQQQSKDELFWIANFIISSGSVPSGFWDYTDIMPLAEKMGVNEQPARLLLHALSGRLTVPEFIQQWQKGFSG